MEVPAIATAGPTPAKLKNGTLVNFTWAHVHAVSDSKEFTEPPTLPAPPRPKKGGIPVVPPGRTPRLVPSAN